MLLSSMAVNNRRRKAYTLIDIMLLIIVITFISSTFTTKVVGSYRRSQDFQRQQHIRSLSNAMLLQGHDDLSIYDSAACSEQLK